MEYYCDLTWVWNIHAAESSESDKCRYSPSCIIEITYETHWDNIGDLFKWDCFMIFQTDMHSRFQRDTPGKKKASQRLSKSQILYGILLFLICFRVINYSKKKENWIFFLWDNIWYILRRHFSAVMWPTLKTKTFTLHNSKSITIYHKIIYFYICSHI